MGQIERYGHEESLSKGITEDIERGRNPVKRKWKKILCIFMAVFIWACASGAGSDRFYQEPETLRVGFFYLSGYHEMDEEGNPSGYGYEYLQHLAVYGNWNYEYIGYENSWTDMLNMLEQGEIDILTGVQKSEERLEKFEFSNQSIGFSNTMVTVAAGNDQYFANDFPNWNGVRVGLLKNYTRNESFQRYAQENGFTYEPVYFESTPELVEALKKGDEIDMAVSSNLRNVQGEWILAEFDPSPFYIIVKKGNTELMDQINEAISQMSMYEPSVTSELWDKYYYSNSSSEIAYTGEERKYISDMANKTFTAVISPDCVPLSYVENGQQTGILYDIAQKVIERTGLNIEIIPAEDRAEYQKILKNQECDICLDAWYNYAEAEKQGYSLTLPYFTTSISSLRMKGNTGSDSIAAIKGLDMLDHYFKKLRPNQEIVYYDTMEEAIEAVKSGKQDEVLLYTRCAEYAAYHDIRNLLVTEKIHEMEPQFSIAVSNRENTLLLSILSKACGSLSEEEVADSMMKYASYSGDEITLLGYLYRNPLMVLLTLAIILGVLGLIAGLIHSYQASKREHRRVLEETRKNKLLQDTLVMAKQAGEAKSTFLSRISHEMRTPLNAIIGYMHLAGEEQVSKKEMLSYVNKSEVAAKQLLSIISDVLDASALERGKMKLNVEPFKISNLKGSMEQMFGSMAREKRIDFRIEEKDIAVDCVNGDEMKVSQILTNLLSNAMKFTPEGGQVVLTIAQMAQKEQMVYYEFTVADNGIGMEDVFLEKIGEPFLQEHGQIGIEYGGTGLGVSIVKMLVAMMKGKVIVTSKKNVGTEFRIELPFEAAECCPMEKSPDREEAEKPYLKFAGREILVVEDNTMNMEIMVNMLQNVRFKITCAGNGQEAVEAFAASAENQFSAVLMDIQMPVMDGYEAARRIRELPRADAGNVPILAITANAFEEDVAASLAAGMNEHISKPIDFHILFEKLDHLI